MAQMGADCGLDEGGLHVAQAGADCGSVVGGLWLSWGMVCGSVGGQTVAQLGGWSVVQLWAD